MAFYEFRPFYEAIDRIVSSQFKSQVGRLAEPFGCDFPDWVRFCVLELLRLVSLLQDDFWFELSVHTMVSVCVDKLARLTPKYSEQSEEAVKFITRVVRERAQVTLKLQLSTRAARARHAAVEVPGW